MAVLTPHSLNRLLAYRCSVWRLVCAQSAGAADDFVSPPPGLDEGGLDLPPFEEPPPHDTGGAGGAGDNNDGLGPPPADDFVPAFDDLPPSSDGLTPPGGGGGAGAYSVFTVFAKTVL